MAVFSRLSNVVLIGLTVLSLISSVPAHAAVKAEDGQRLKTLFTEMIERYRNESKLQGGDLLTEGEVMRRAQRQLSRHHAAAHDSGGRR